MLVGKYLKKVMYHRKFIVASMSPKQTKSLEHSYVS